MKNIENRLAKAEAITAKSEFVLVEFKDPEAESKQIPLLDAIRLFLDGKLLSIRYIMKSGEERQYLNDTIKQIEEYIDKNY